MGYNCIFVEGFVGVFALTDPLSLMRVFHFVRLVAFLGICVLFCAPLCVFVPFLFVRFAVGSWRVFCLRDFILAYASCL